MNRENWLDEKTRKAAADAGITIFPCESERYPDGRTLHKLKEIEALEGYDPTLQVTMQTFNKEAFAEAMGDYDDLPDFAAASAELDDALVRAGRPPAPVPEPDEMDKIFLQHFVPKEVTERIAGEKAGPVPWTRATEPPSFLGARLDDEPTPADDE